MPVTGIQGASNPVAAPERHQDGVGFSVGYQAPYLLLTDRHGSLTNVTENMGYSPPPRCPLLAFLLLFRLIFKSDVT